MTIRSFNGLNPKFNESVYIDPTALVIGDVTLAEDASIWPGTVVRGDVNFIKIGARTNIQDNSVIHVAHVGELDDSGYPTIIGSGVTVGHRAMLHGCTIDDNVLIGMGAIVLDGAHIEENVFIGAGALVPQHKVMESGFLYLGSPARRIRELTEQEIASLDYSANNYVGYKNQYLAEA